MDKTDTTAAAQNGAVNFIPLFGSDELKLQTTPKAVTPFAGMASLFAWLGALGSLPEGMGIRCVRADSGFF